MAYGPWDEYFIHQLPQTFDQVHDADNSWSDRCYFNAHSPDGTVLLVSGFGNNPNTQSAMGYAKLALADGRHWDLDASRECKTDRGDLYAGAMRWTCVEPLKQWTIELGPNDSGIEFELHYESTAPLWELLPVYIRKGDRVLADMQHIKQPARYTGWLDIEGDRTSVDGFIGGRDRTFGVRVADQIDFWLWLDIAFEDRAIEAWIFETADGTVQYVDGGFTHTDGSLSKRFVKLEHDIVFDGDQKRPIHANIVFTDEDGEQFHVKADAPHPDVNVYYGLPLPSRKASDGTGFYSWSSSDREETRQVENLTVSLDQLMDFDMGGMKGHGIFEILFMGDRYPRYPTWGPMDLGFAAQ